MVADDDVVDRRGRDKALDGPEQVADQPGKIKMKKSDDLQKDISTGVGGKKVDSDDTHFSLHDSGTWKDEFVKRMDKPQKKNSIVERQGDKIDAATAPQLRDLTSKQEQVIERLKAIKKELRTCTCRPITWTNWPPNWRPTWQHLKERPDPDLFRLQLQTLDGCAAVRVFRGAAGIPAEPAARTPDPRSGAGRAGRADAAGL